MSPITTEYPQFFTATNLEWKRLLKPDKYKDIIIAGMRFLVEDKRVKIFSFVIFAIVGVLQKEVRRRCVLCLAMGVGKTPATRKEENPNLVLYVMPPILTKEYPQFYSDEPGMEAVAQTG